MKPLILFPFGGNTREAIDVIIAINEKIPTWDLLGFVDDNPETHSLREGKFSVLGDRSVLREYPDAFLFAAPGSPTSFLNRAKVLSSFNWPLDQMPTLIDPSCRVSQSAQVGRNTIILAHSFLGAQSLIGNHVVILSNCVVSHDTSIGDLSLVGAGTSIASRVSIGKNCYIGAGVRIRENVKVGDHALIGMGAVVLKDVPSHSTVIGCPAKPFTQSLKA